MPLSKAHKRILSCSERHDVELILKRPRGNGVGAQMCTGRKETGHDKTVHH